jgi:hypothetical protein
MARIRISIAYLSVVCVGAVLLAAFHLAPIRSVSVAHPAPPGTGPASAAVATSAEPQPSGRDTAVVQGSVAHAPQTPGRAVARPRGAASPTPAAPRPFTGLHIAFPRPWHSAAYEVRGPQKPPVRLVCPCPEDHSTQTSANQSIQSGQTANGSPSDARVTLLEWNP